MERMRREELEELYVYKRKSAKEIADIFSCSENKINYWLKKYDIPKRSISEAVYQRSNPKGDPFRIMQPKTHNESFLLGLGVGLYWGEGTKRNRYAIRLGNTDPRLIKKFIEFLEESYAIDKSKLRFSLQVFSDMSPQKTLRFWIRELGFPRSQFQKVIITPSGSLGTYRYKTKHGVLTVYYGNKRLRDLLCNAIDELH